MVGMRAGSQRQYKHMLRAALPYPYPSSLLISFVPAFDTAAMGRVDLPPPETHEGYPPPAEDEVVITIERDWTVEEEKKAKRKYEACF